MHSLTVRLGGAHGRRVGILARQGGGYAFRYAPGYALDQDARPLDPIRLPVRESPWMSSGAQLDGPLAGFAHDLPGPGARQTSVPWAWGLREAPAGLQMPPDLLEQLALSSVLWARTATPRALFFEAEPESSREAAMWGRMQDRVLSAPRSAPLRAGSWRHDGAGRVLMDPALHPSVLPLPGTRHRVLAPLDGTAGYLAFEAPGAPRLLAHRLAYNQLAQACGLRVPPMRGARVGDRLVYWQGVRKPGEPLPKGGCDWWPERGFPTGFVTPLLPLSARVQCSPRRRFQSDTSRAEVRRPPPHAGLIHACDRLCEQGVEVDRPTVFRRLAFEVATGTLLADDSVLHLEWMAGGGFAPAAEGNWRPAELPDALAGWIRDDALDRLSVYADALGLEALDMARQIQAVREGLMHWPQIAASCGLDALETEALSPALLRASLRQRSLGPRTPHGRQ